MEFRVETFNYCPLGAFVMCRTTCCMFVLSSLRARLVLEMYQPLCQDCREDQRSSTFFYAQVLLAPVTDLYTVRH